MRSIIRFAQPARVTLLSVVSLLLAGAWRPSATAPVPRATSIVGDVLDAGTNAPVASAEVQVRAANGAVVSFTTNARGQFSGQLPAVSAGQDVVVMARRLGYAPSTRRMRASTDTLRVQLRLQATVTRLEDAKIAAVRAVTSTAPAAPTSVRNATYERLARQDAPWRRPPTSTGLIDSSRTPDWNREQYDRIQDNPFLSVRGNPLSTFSVDVDRASYGNVRRFLTQGQLPPADAVRIEELVNYFPYTLAEPRGDDPVAITTEVTPAPWQPRHQIVRIALQARRIATASLPASNLVFLIDVSGSMNSPDKLPLVQSSLRLLVEQLRPIDRVAIVVYAGAAGLVLPSTSGDEKARIMAAIDQLEAGGSTAGGAGIELAYRTARENFVRDGNNRVILATDGDFNVGVSSDAAMERLVESKRAEGTYLTVLGFGTGNYQDAKMAKMAKVGNGNYAYVDDIAEARKVLVHEMGATLVTVANDVKLQVEFNPRHVAAYRLIGYEDRLLRNEDFRDDTKDAGDMGAGHTVTALYEVVPVGVRGTVTVRDADSLRYRTPTREVNGAAGRDELLQVSLRYKRPGEGTSRVMRRAILANEARPRGTDDMRFASAVAAFGMLLRNSEYRGAATGDMVRTLARDTGDDEAGYRREFLQLVDRWSSLSRGIAKRPARPD